MKNHLLEQTRTILHEEQPIDTRLHKICTLLNSTLLGYDWVGFYLVDPTQEKMLKLGPYVGSPTDHVFIPFGKGICGQAAESLATFVVPDVSKESNYLSCSLTVKSEIVLPLIHEGVFLGELDIDSHVIDRFQVEDQALLEEMCLLISPFLAMSVKKP
jgi:L-methionine (R)-S-oxide reductase